MVRNSEKSRYLLRVEVVEALQEGNVESLLLGVVGVHFGDGLKEAPDGKRNLKRQGLYLLLNQKDLLEGLVAKSFSVENSCRGLSKLKAM